MRPSRPMPEARSRERSGQLATNSDTPAIQNARNGRSDSRELPFTTERRQRKETEVSPTMDGARSRCASDHIDITAISENSNINRVERDLADVSRIGRAAIRESMR